MFVSLSKYLHVVTALATSEAEREKVKATLAERDSAYYDRKMTEDRKYMVENEKRYKTDTINKLQREIEITKAKYDAAMAAIGRPTV